MLCLGEKHSIFYMCRFARRDKSGRRKRSIGGHHRNSRRSHLITNEPECINAFSRAKCIHIVMKCKCSRSSRGDMTSVQSPSLLNRAPLGHSSSHPTSKNHNTNRRTLRIYRNSGWSLVEEDTTRIHWNGTKRESWIANYSRWLGISFFFFLRSHRRGCNKKLPVLVGKIVTQLWLDWSSTMRIMYLFFRF